MNLKMPLLLTACVAAVFCLSGCVANATQINPLDAQGCATPNEFEGEYDVFVRVVTNCEVATEKQQLADALGLAALYVPLDEQGTIAWTSPLGNNCVLLVATNDDTRVAVGIQPRFTYFEAFSTGVMSVQEAKEYIDTYREQLCVELPTI